MSIRNRNNRRRAGITLIEMLVVLTIIALFATLVAPKMFKQADKAKVVKAMADMNGLMNALGQYKLDTGNFPTTEQGLKALMEKPQGVNQWGGPYLSKEIPADPWGHPYVYKFPGDHGDEPDIMSYGADGQAGGTDINADVLSWKN